MIEQKEENIEANICEYLMLKGAKVDKIISEGFYDQNKGTYRKRKSSFASPGIADIIGCIDGRYFAIEVKKPSEMKFFNRSIEELMQECIKAQMRNISSATLKRYHHAVNQRKFLDDVIQAGGIAFFASSIEEVRERFETFFQEKKDYDFFLKEAKAYYGDVEFCFHSAADKYANQWRFFNPMK